MNHRSPQALASQASPDRRPETAADTLHAPRSTAAVSPSSPSPQAILKAQARETKLLAWLDAKASGSDTTVAARAVGVPVVTLHRWQRRYAHEGLRGLMDRCWRSGRESVAETLRRLCGEAAWELSLLAVRGLALDLDGSAGAAWRQFARIGADIDAPVAGLKCMVKRTRLHPPQPIRDYFARVGAGRRSKHSISKSLLDLVKPTPILSHAHRGRRALSLKGAYTPRKLDILPGDVFTSDDTTPIWAWWVPWPKSEEYPFGCKVLQGQFLPVIDIASQMPLAFALIAREKSSYRAADIWALFGYVFDKFGLPRLGVQFERGSWEANLIAGAKVTYQRGETSHTQRVGGLRMLPTNLLPYHLAQIQNLKSKIRNWKTLQTWTSYLPKSKSVEAFFHRSQKLEGTLYGCLGRDQMRRPFERSKKIFEACKRNAEDPRLHFLRGDELAGRLRDLLAFYGGDRIEGEVFYGKPEEVWAGGIAEHGDLLRLPEDQQYLFRRDWSVCKISQGWVKPSRTDEVTGRKASYFYQNPALFAERDGAEVLVYFDREDFESPAQIHDLDGRYLGAAEYFSRKGMFLDGEMDGHELRRLYAGAVMTLYAQIAPHCPSRQLPAEIAERRAVAAALRDAGCEAGGASRCDAATMEAKWQDGRGGVARYEISSATEDGRRQTGGQRSSVPGQSFQRDTGEARTVNAEALLPDRGTAPDTGARLDFSRGTDGVEFLQPGTQARHPNGNAVRPRVAFDRDAAADHIARREAEARERGELIET